MDTLDTIRQKKAFISDMDGVIYRGTEVLPGAKPFLDWLKRSDKRYLFLTNSSERTPRQLADKLSAMGIGVEPEHFMTIAFARRFFYNRSFNGRSRLCHRAEHGLLQALEETGFILTQDRSSDYVFLGDAETQNFTYEKIRTGHSLCAGRCSSDRHQIPT